MKRLITLLILITFVLSACGGKNEPTPLPTAERAAGGIATPIPTATSAGGGGILAPKPTVAQSGPQISKLNVGELVYVNQVEMFDPLRGWMVGTAGTYKSDQNDHVFLTYNAGQSVSERTPPEAATTSNLRATLVAQSLDRAWVTYYPDDYVSQPSVVWYTIDGGLNWNAPPAFDTAGLDNPKMKLLTLQFFDDNEGLVVLTGETAANKAPVYIYRTTDGGKTWSRVLDPSSNSGGALGDCCLNGMAVLDKTTAVMTSITVPNPKPHVNWTKDGGKTWTAQEVPPADEELFSKSLCGTEAPKVVEGTVIMVVNCIEYRGMAEKHVPFLYFTADRGGVWQFLPLPIFPFAEGAYDSIQRTHKLVFMDGSNGYFFVEDIYTAKTTKEIETKNQMFATYDGGQNWSKVNFSIWIGQYSFVNANTAWAAALFNTAHTLVKTTDGGKTWLKLVPSVDG